MLYKKKTITVDVDVYVDDVLDDIDDDYLVEEMEVRGYTCYKSQIPQEQENRLTRGEFDVIFSMLNDLDDWEHRRIREKLQMMEQLT